MGFQKRRWERTVWVDRLLQSAKRGEALFYKGARKRLSAEDRALREKSELPYEELGLPLIPAQTRTDLRSVLIFKPDDIGDCIFALPALAELRRELPHARLFFVCQNKTAPIFERVNLVDEIAPVDPQLRLFRFPRFDPKSYLQQFSIKRFDLAIFLRTYPVYFRQFKRVPSRCYLHPHDPRFKSNSPYQARISAWSEKRAHQAQQLLEILSPITGKRYRSSDVAFPSFQFLPSDRDEVERHLNSPSRPLVVIHPFNRLETKRYPEGYWIELIGRLRQELTAQWVVIGGPGDPALESLYPFPDILQLQGKLSLGATGYLMSQASAFVGNESGPGHWAAALGLPTLTIMSGHSDPDEWMPLGNSLVFRREMPCSPCHLRACPKYQVACLRTLTPEKVFRPAAEFLRTALETPRDYWRSYGPARVAPRKFEMKIETFLE